jgi:hypothetical protein
MAANPDLVRVRCSSVTCAMLLSVLGCGSSSSASTDAASDAALAEASDDTGSIGDSFDAADGSGDSAGSCPGDVFAPSPGGARYYASWTHGPPSTDTFFPISVWLQSPSNAKKYAAIGINQYIGIYAGPTSADLATLDTQKMPVFCDQNATALAHLSDPIMRGFTQPDEPDNAQSDGKGGYGPCVDPAVITASYATWRAADPSRPVFLSFGQGASDTAYIGRGSACASKTDMYPKYIAGADIVSFDIYPVNNAAGKSAPKLWMVAQGVDNLRGWASNAKPVWVWIETTNINGDAKPTTGQVRMEIWSAIVHGALGIGYFAHQIGPTFVEAALLADATMSAAVSDLNAQITSLAPVLNTPTIANGARVASSNSTIPIDTMVKRKDGATYVFAVGMRDGSTTGTFQITCAAASGKAEVIGESRTVDVKDGTFVDAFEPYAVHLYKL